MNLSGDNLARGNIFQRAGVVYPLIHGLATVLLLGVNQGPFPRFLELASLYNLKEK